MSMNKHTKGAIVVIGVLAIGLAVFHLMHQNAKAYARQIIKLNGTTGSYAMLITFDEGYLKAWAMALSKGKAEFVYNAERYNTSGGKKIVS